MCTPDVTSLASNMPDFQQQSLASWPAEKRIILLHAISKDNASGKVGVNRSNGKFHGQASISTSC